MLNYFWKSSHQYHVEKFMKLAKQDVPDEPTEPSLEVRKLRAKLILEEALETIEALGISADVRIGPGDYVLLTPATEFLFHNGPSDFNLVEVIDGCCDLAVVTTGTLSACGIPDVAFQREVDRNNLAKFGPGHSIREDGKLIKPPDHKSPMIAEMLRDLSSPDNSDRGPSLNECRGY